MDRRVQPRISSDEVAQVTVFGDKTQQVSGRVANLTGRGMQLIVSRSIPPGTALSIDTPDRLYMGEVVYCNCEGLSYRVGVEVEQALRHTDDLARLRDAISEMSLAEVRVNRRMIR